ncbi:MAG TPA: undecaprenyl-diphosphate phosphatase [Chitinophagales bacterium]|nr:undecaprenyl-diphosphate phosphatase [Chitinophagales bacterium]
MTTAQAVVLAIVEGLTEFLPVSSTGHMILAEGLMHMEQSPLAKVYIINIQFGAILSVLVLYWRRFFQSLDFYKKIFVAFLPAAVIGLLLNKVIDRLLGSVITVAVSLVVGGVILVLADKFFKKQIENVPEDEDVVTVIKRNEFGLEVEETQVLLNITWLQAFIVGCFQVLAMIPGVSRSASTIIGGLTQKFSIKKAAEFSFFLAVPTVFAAAMFKLLKQFSEIKGTDIGVLVMGNVIAFIVGVLAIRFFIGLLTKYGLKFFGYYRIIAGLIILILYAIGYNLELVG